ncbi:hypothetical protein JMT66_05265 [Kosakonia cowanii]|uniref:hypothetical protein n=1 Tax=Kosakonia cowanii TaxID=208223 RepID=UPI001E580520|nr:hypothetical protein [Kosakonia cowanii]UGS47090.1 hypothetical protein JMT66_05265 [Kosakonia cowanii]
MKAQLSRERLESAVNAPTKVILNYGDTLKMARMLLAAMVSEPFGFVRNVDDFSVMSISKTPMTDVGVDKPLYAAPPAPVAAPVPGHADCCPECGSKSLRWDVAVAKTSDVVQGRLRTSDVTGMFFLGCDECSETVSNVRMENIAVFLNACRAAMLKAGPVTAATVPDGWKLVPVEPTAEMCKAGYEAQDKWPSEQCDNFKERHYSFSQPRYKAMLAAAPAAPEQEV